MRKKKENLRENGITLVALVVTIIILLILAGVTIRLAIGDRGIFQMSQGAVDAYEQSAKNEMSEIEEFEEQFKKLQSDVLPQTPPEEEKQDRSKLNIGDKVNYKPDDYHPEEGETGYPLEDKYSGYDSGNGGKQTIKQEDYTWKIINKKDDGTVDIMGIPDSNKTKVYFKGPTGYNNGVYLLNDICKKLYSNSGLGATARSINIVDIENHLNGAVLANGNITTYTTPNSNYPILAKYEDHVGVDNNTMGSLHESESGTSSGEINIPLEETDLTNYSNSKESASTKLYVKQTYYHLSQTDSHFDHSGISSVMFDSSIADYWLASRYSDCQSDHAGFGLRTAGKNGTNGTGLYRSDATSNADSAFSHGGHCLAPVVTLGSNIQFTGDGTSGWTLSKPQ